MELEGETWSQERNSGRGSGRENVTCWTKKMAEKPGVQSYGEWKRRCLASWAVPRDSKGDKMTC